MADSIPAPSQETLIEFARIGEVAATTTHLLALSLHARTRLGGAEGRARPLELVEHFVLQQARDYLAVAREGFSLSARTDQAVSMAELRFLLDRVLLDWDALAGESGQGHPGGNAGLGIPPAEGTARLRHQLLAFGMAAAALGMLPRTPADEVTFPYSHGSPPTYADIAAPSSPAGLLARLEEMERLLWDVMGGGLQGLVNRRYGSLRRTYGFFEVSARLARREAERYGLKPARAIERLT